MYKIPLKSILFSVLLCSNILFAQIQDIKKLEWIDPYGRVPKSFQKWHREQRLLQKGTGIGLVYKKNVHKNLGLVDVIVNARLITELEAEIERYMNDLVDAGYSVRVDTTNDISCQALRMHLASLNPVGAIFVGELPTAWYESNGFGTWEEFPIDLYFMDLDGEWIDSDSDGLYDNHTGDVAPEIWIGRLYARTLTWDNEIRLLKRYFEKNHQYRIGELAAPQRALSFVDDDWSSYFSPTCGLNYVYSDVTVINDGSQTTANAYRNELGQGYEWIHICAHSSPWGHTFKVPVDKYQGTVFNYEIFVLEPYALFYNLFACSGTRFVEENYSAGWYIFNDSYGLLAVGSTKTGSMLSFGDFYQLLGEGKCIGDAFKGWFIQHGESSRDWFYGLNIIGDPTLKPLVGTAVTKKRQYKFQCMASDWSSVRVGSHPESDGNPSILSDRDGKLWIIWESGRSYVNGRSDIYCVYRDTGGWSSLMNVGPHKYWDFNPTIGIDKLGRPCAIWANFAHLQYNLYYSIYNGSYWTARKSISVDPSWDLKPQLVTDKTGKLWLVWQARRVVSSDIYVATFDGYDWSSPQMVTISYADELYPSIVVDSTNTPWIFYCRIEASTAKIYGSYYDSTGWIEIGPISANQTTAYKPTSCVSSAGRIWVSWQSFDDGNGNIYASYYTGNYWTYPIPITVDSQNDLFPDMAAGNDGSVCIVWQTKRDGNWNIYNCTVYDTVWTTPTPVTVDTGVDINPKITSDKTGKPWVVWQNYKTDWEIYVAGKEVVGIVENEIDPEYDSLRLYPNPFISKVQIESNKYRGYIRIYNKVGALVKMIEPKLSSKKYVAEWDGTDFSCKKLAPGIYFVRIGTPVGLALSKVIYLGKK